MDMTVTVNGPLALAEEATRMVFGVDANRGPVMPAPLPLLELKDQWPGHPDEPADISLQMPPNPLAEQAKNTQMGLVLRCNRITILHNGKAVGFAIRTDDLGINAIVAWKRAWAIHRQIRAH